MVLSMLTCEMKSSRRLFYRIQICGGGGGCDGGHARFHARQMMNLSLSLSLKMRIHLHHSRHRHHRISTLLQIQLGEPIQRLLFHRLLPLRIHARSLR